MTDDTDDLDRHLARLFEKGRRREDPEDHPSPEELSAYQAGELPPEKAGEIQEHLTQCRICTGLLLDLERFLGPGEEPVQEGVADFGAEAGWRELRGRMGGMLADKAPMAPVAEVARLRRSLRTFQSLAAVLLVALGLLASYVWLVRPAGRGPDLNAQVVTLASLAGVRGNGGEIKKVELKRGAGDLTLVLGAPESDYPHYQLDLQDPQGQVRSYPGLEKDGNDFSLSLSREELSAGRYQIRIYGLEQGASHLVGEYEFELFRR